MQFRLEYQYIHVYTSLVILLPMHFGLEYQYIIYAMGDFIYIKAYLLFVAKGVVWYIDFIITVQLLVFLLPMQSSIIGILGPRPLRFIY